MAGTALPGRLSWQLARLVTTQTETSRVMTRSHPDGWPGYTRRIDRAMLADAAGEPAPGRLAYVCGPTRLVENVANALVALGYPTDRVKTERFGPSGPGG